MQAAIRIVARLGICFVTTLAMSGNMAALAR